MHSSLHPRVHVRGIAFELGDPACIGEIRELQDDPPTLDMLLAMGMEKYLKSDMPPMELARRSLLKTLESANRSPEDVDLLLYVSESFPMVGQISEDLGLLCTSLGLANAYPTGLCLSTCGNMAMAFRIAAASLAAGRYRTVAILASDVVMQGESRLLPPSVTVFSDGASSCLLSLEPGPGYSVLGQALFANNGIWGGETLDLIKALSMGISTVCAEALQASGKTPAQCRKLLMNNYNQSVQRLFCVSGGFRKDQLYLANLSRHAHIGTSDILVNLHHFTEYGSPVAGDTFCLLSTGPSMCGALVVEHR